MKREDFEKKTFGEVVSEMLENEDCVTTYDDLKNFAKEKVDSDDLLTATHILQAIHEDTAEYYLYDYSMGTMETPSSVTSKEDIEHLIED